MFLLHWNIVYIIIIIIRFKVICNFHSKSIFCTKEFYFFYSAYLGLFDYIDFKLFFSGFIRKKSAGEEACIEP